MGYLATGEIFENMLQLKGFGLYFEGVRLENGSFHIEIMISATCRARWDSRGFGGKLPEKILKWLMQSGEFCDRCSTVSFPIVDQIKS